MYCRSLRGDEITEKHVNFINDELGRNYTDCDDLKTVCDTGVVKIIEGKGAVLGIVVAKIVKCEDTEEIIGFKHEIICDNYNKEDSVVVVKTVLVNRMYRNIGLCEILIKSIINEFSESNRIIAVGFNIQNISNNLWTKNKFKHLITLNKYWIQDNSENDYNCCICSKNPCECSAEIFMYEK